MYWSNLSRPRFDQVLRFWPTSILVIHCECLPSHCNNATHQGIFISQPCYEDKCMECGNHLSVLLSHILLLLVPYNFSICSYWIEFPDKTPWSRGNAGINSDQRSEFRCYRQLGLNKCEEWFPKKPRLVPQNSPLDSLAIYDIQHSFLTVS